MSEHTKGPKFNVACALFIGGLLTYVVGANPHAHGLEYLMGGFMGAAIALFATNRSATQTATGNSDKIGQVG